MSNKPHIYRGDSHYILVAGFISILILMAILTLVGLKKTVEVNDRLEVIVQQLNVKAALIKKMRITARERVFTMQKMMLTTDIFKQDEAAISIDQLGSEFGQARQQLLAMPLAPHERAMLDIQGNWTQQAVPIHRDAVNLIISGQHEEARKLLQEQVIPTQTKVLTTLIQMESQQDAAIQSAFSEAVNTHKQTRVQLIVLGVFTMWLCVLIAIFAIKNNHRKAQQLQQEKERALITLHSIGDGVITADAHGTIEYLNPVAEQLTGWRNRAAEGKALLDIFHVVEGDTLLPSFSSLDELLSADDKGDSIHQCMLIDANHASTAIGFNAATIRNEDGDVSGIVVTFRDVSELRAIADHLSHQARHDPLTNLLNRREFELRLEQALLEAQQENQQHALCFLDLDRFKIVNDSCGHAAGDELLIQLVARLKARVRSNDLLARLGGDEFGLLLENCPLNKAQKIAEEIRGTINNFIFVWEQQSFSVGVSIGMVMINANSGTLSEIIAKADAACYSAKDGGRNRVHIYNDRESIEGQVSEPRLPWAERLQHALQNDSFALYCQSIVAVNPLQERLHLCELQLRFTDEQGQHVPPMAFIPAAERHNLMNAIDRWVVRHACQLIQLINDPNAVYCINLSLQSLDDEGFLPALQQLLQSHNIAPGQLCFEITESSAISDLQRVTTFISALRAIGCRSALDDVGRSIGSYDYLKGLEVDFIKIDGHIISGVTHSTINSVQVRAITQIAHLLKICVIAEMVEDHNTLKLLGGLGINYAQGFGIAKPRPVAELSEALATAADSVSEQLQGSLA